MTHLDYPRSMVQAATTILNNLLAAPSSERWQPWYLAAIDEAWKCVREARVAMCFYPPLPPQTAEELADLEEYDDPQLPQEASIRPIEAFRYAHAADPNPSN